MKNALIDFRDWTLVVIAFGLVIASIYKMDGFNWFKF